MCWRWRRLVLSTAELWSEIRIPIYAAPRITDDVLSRLLLLARNRCVSGVGAAATARDAG